MGETCRDIVEHSMCDSLPFSESGQTWAAIPRCSRIRINNLPLLASADQETSDWVARMKYLSKPSFFPDKLEFREVGVGHSINGMEWS